VVARSSSNRTQRMESQIQRELATLLSREVKDPRVGQVTVTQVTLAADMSLARVYVVPFARDDVKPEFLEGLQAAAGFLRGEVGRRVGLRHAPRLLFEIDESIDRAARLTALIDAANKPST
jgi:ribosome-binding factor A